MASQQPLHLACSAQATPTGSRGLAGFWLIIVPSQLFNITLLWAVWIAATFIKGHHALIWHCVCRIWPALHGLVLFIAAELLIIPKLVPNLHIILYAVFYIKVFSCSSGTVFWKDKKKQKNNRNEKNYKVSTLEHLRQYSWYSEYVQMLKYKIYELFYLPLNLQTRLM